MGHKLVGYLYKFNEGFLKNYSEKSNEGHFLEVGVNYPESLYKPHNDLSFLLEIKKVDKVKNLATNLHDKKEYIINIRNLKRVLKH